MVRYCLVDTDGLIHNTVLWDGESDWTPPDGLTPVLEDEAQAQGCRYPDPAPVVDEPPTAHVDPAALAAARDAVAKSTTVAQLRAVLTELLGAITPDA